MAYQGYHPSNLAVKEKKTQKPSHRIHIHARKGAGRKRRQRSFQKNMMVVLYIMILGCALIYGKIRLMEENNTLAATQEQLEELQQEYEQLETEVNNMVSIGSIEEQAKAAGMTELQPSQVENIVVETEDVAEVSEQERTVLDQLADLWEELKAYITE